MSKTGEICQIAGIYKCSEHPNHQITMPEGHRFPPCDKKSPAHSANWILVQKTKH